MKEHVYGGIGEAQPMKCKRLGGRGAGKAVLRYQEDLVTANKKNSVSTGYLISKFLHRNGRVRNMDEYQQG